MNVCLINCVFEEKECNDCNNCYKEYTRDEDDYIIDEYDDLLSEWNNI